MNQEPKSISMPETPTPTPKPTPTPTTDALPSPHTSGGSVWPWIIGAAAAAGVLYLVAPSLGLLPKKPASGSAGGEKGGAPAARPVPVVVATARKGDMNIYLTGLGAVTAFNTVTIHSRVDGELVNVAFTEGQLVKEGDLLAEIDPRPFQVMLMSAQGKLQEDQANHLNAQANLDRFKSAKDAISDQQIDSMAATVAQFEGAIMTDQSAIDNAKLQLTYCKITSPINGKIGLRLVDKGNLVHASDLNGLAVVTQIQPISVIFPLPEDDLGLVFGKPNAGTGLPVELYDRDLTKKLSTGKLSTIDNQIDASTATVRFKAEFENKDSSLFPNQFVNARLLLDTRKGVTILPAAAVQRSPNSTFVYVVKPSAPGEAPAAPAEKTEKSEKGEKGAEKAPEKPAEEVELREVTVGPSEGEEVIIEQGVAPGEVVVTEGVDKLQPGSKVLPKHAPTGAKKGDKAKAGDKPEKGDDKHAKKSEDKSDEAAEKADKSEKAPR